MNKKQTDTAFQIRDVVRNYYAVIRKLSFASFPLDPEAALLLVLMGDRVLSIKQLTDDCYFGTNVSYFVSQLRDAGFIRYDRDTSDGRFRLVRLTAKGRDTVTRIMTKLVEENSFVKENMA